MPPDADLKSPVITDATLRRIMPAAPALSSWVEPLCTACRAWDITTPARLAGFIANVAHESGQLRYVREIASGEAYEARRDLGNAFPGDGRRFKGRGLIQITGRANYARASIALTGDEETLIIAPEMLETRSLAAESAAWFWSTTGLNAVMDQGDFQGACAIINTGRRNTPAARIRGWQDRLQYYARAQAAMGA